MFIPYGHQSVTKRDIRAVTQTLMSDWLTQGPAIEQFERALAVHCRARYAVVFSNGTAALHGAYWAMGLHVGDEFITTPLTFVATANAGLYCGARPVFADVDMQGNLDPQSVRSRISKKTRMISVVDFAGHPAQLDALRAVAREHACVLIEDACHALGATYKRKPVGSISDMTIFSFHPVKSITTGEGGAVLTDNKEWYERMVSFRTHGITKDPNRLTRPSPGDWYYEMQSLGFNYRMTDIQAALGKSQLERLPVFIKKRQAIADLYARELGGCPELVLPTVKKDMVSSWHLYVIRLKPSFAHQRDQLFQFLRSRQIGVQVHYLPVYHQPYYRHLGYRDDACPRAEEYFAGSISLPMFPDLRRSDQGRVIRELKNGLLKLHSV